MLYIRLLCILLTVVAFLYARPSFAVEDTTLEDLKKRWTEIVEDIVNVTNVLADHAAARKMTAAGHEDAYHQGKHRHDDQGCDEL